MEKGKSPRKPRAKETKPRGSRAPDLSGNRYGNLTILSIAPKGEWTSKGSHWKCKCDCGNVITMAMRFFARQLNPKTDCGCIKKPVEQRLRVTRKPALIRFINFDEAFDNLSRAWKDKRMEDIKAMMATTKITADNMTVHRPGWNETEAE